MSPANPKNIPVIARYHIITTPRANAHETVRKSAFLDAAVLEVVSFHTFMEFLNYCGKLSLLNQEC